MRKTREKYNLVQLKPNIKQRASNSSKDDWYVPYIGVYGHLLLGNISVYYNETDSKLHFLTGRYGQGWLESSVMEYMFYQNAYGSLWHVYNTGPLAGLKPLMAFSYLVNESFQNLEDLGYEPARPPVFKRDLQWIDLPGEAGFLKASLIQLTLCLAMILLNPNVL